MNKNEWKWVWGAFRIHRRDYGLWGAILRLPFWGRYFTTPVSDGENLTMTQRLKREFDKAYRDLDYHYAPIMENWREEVRKMLKPGDAVIVNPPMTGSVGIITSSRYYDDGFYVTYCYGRDVKGDLWQSTGSMARRDLIPISRRLYDKHSDCRCFSAEQKLVHAEILKELREQGWITRGAYDDFIATHPMEDAEEAKDQKCS